MSSPGTPGTPDPQSLDQITRATGLGAFVVGGVSQGGGSQWGQQVDASNVTGMALGGMPDLLGGGITDIPSALVKLGEFLLTLPLEVLQMLAQFIPGVDSSMFGDVATAVDTILNAILIDPFSAFMSLVQALIKPFTDL